jgi:dTDP-4-amino-4,6-dideoxygalactose transaminase
MSGVMLGLKNGPVVRERFRFVQPTLPPLQEVIDQYKNSYDNSLITNGAVVRRLECAVQEFLGVQHCVAVSSCTSGLMLVLRALECTGEVILPSFTFFATAHSALWNGLRPVFADCDPQTWNIDPNEAERLITDKTSAIIAVHLYGNPCNVTELERLAVRYRLKLIFDAAHAFGSSCARGRIGAFGDAEVFSLSPTKLLVAGEGGLVTTKDAVLARRIVAARNYGDLGSYDPELIGLNSRMTEFNAALALAGLSRVERKVIRHNEIAQMYTDHFKSVHGISFQHIDSDNTSTWKDYSIVLDKKSLGISRDEIAAELLSQNIETKKYFYPPLHKQQLYTQYYDSSRTAGLSHTNRLTDSVLSLPIYESLPNETISIVAATLIALCQR